ncbi:MAG: alternative ribosome rescue aminoacyl-tRNA hydrolase ArfB [Phycisphaerae bacterium]
MSNTSSFVPGIELGPGVWTDREQLRFGFSRSSGPGGQNVNKVNTKTELRVALAALHGMNDRALGRLRDLAGRRMVDGDLLFTADTERTQESNRRACMEKLRALIEQALVEPKKRKKSKPSKGAKLRRLASKKKQGEKKKERSWRE